MERLFSFTVDLEPDFLSENSHEVLLDPQRFDQIAQFWTENGVRPTVFIVASMLDAGFPVRERFAPLGAEFELHSYSHDLAAPDSEAEIIAARDAYVRHFGIPPRGYRAPCGIISKQGIHALARHGFCYDASVFPSRRPELGYNYSGFPIEPWIYDDAPEITELPFAVIPRIRMTLSMSFLKLFGLNFYRCMFRTLGRPDVLVFDSHLYDFFATSPVKNLKWTDWRKHALLRNQKRVFPLLKGLLDYLRGEGYRFATMSEVYDSVGKNVPRVSTAGLLDRPQAGGATGLGANSG